MDLRLVVVRGGNIGVVLCGEHVSGCLACGGCRGGGATLLPAMHVTGDSKPLATLQYSLRSTWLLRSEIKHHDSCLTEAATTRNLRISLLHFALEKTMTNIASSILVPIRQRVDVLRSRGVGTSASSHDGVDL